MPDPWLTEALAADPPGDGFTDRFALRLRAEQIQARRRRWTRVALLTLAVAVLAPFAFAQATAAGDMLAAAGGWARLAAPVPYLMLAAVLAAGFQQGLDALLRR